MATDPTDICIHIQPDLAAYALGESELSPEVRAHLEACARCQHELRGYARVARVMPYSAPSIAPPPGLRARILAAAQNEQRAPDSPAPAPPAPRKRARIGWAWPSFGLAVAALVALLVWNITLQQQLGRQSADLATSRANWQSMSRMLNAGDLHWYALQGSQASGHFWTSAQEQTACLVAQQLPPLPDGRVYQVWLTRGGTRVSGGVLNAVDGTGWKLIREDGEAAVYETVSVTIEPREGSVAPSGPPVLTGALSQAYTPTWQELQAAQRLLALAKP